MTPTPQAEVQELRRERNGKLRVLLVEDDQDDFVIVRDLLAEVEGCAYELDWVRTYEDGVQAIEDNSHDAYLIDYRLGAHDGLDLLRRSVSSGCHGAVILLTGQGSRDVDLEAMRAGAADYLSKDSISAVLLDRSLRYGVERTAMLQSLSRKSEELVTANRVLQEKDRLLSVLLGIGRTTLTSLDLSEVLDSLTRELVDGGIFRCVAVFLVEPRSAQVQVVRAAARGAAGDAAMLSRLSQYRSLTERSAVCQAVRTGALQVTSAGDERLDAQFDTPAECTGDVFYFTPVKRDAEVMAVLGTSSPRAERREILRTIELMGPLLDQAAIALDHAFKTRDLKQAHAHLVQAEKMSSLGQLVAGVAHEINNPAGFVHSGLQTLVEYVADLRIVLEGFSRLYQAATQGQPHEIERAVADVRQVCERYDLDRMMADIEEIVTDGNDGMQRVTAIVQGLKDFARVDETRLVESDLNAGLEETLRLVANQLKYHCEVDKRLGQIPPIHCYPGQLNQVFVNLLVNAAQSIPEWGTVTVETWADDDWVCVRIADTGVGIPEEIRHRIFEPFFTTKATGEGTGLGLAISYNIVQAHKGVIDVTSRPGAGTEFVVKIPTDLARRLRSPGEEQ